MDDNFVFNVIEYAMEPISIRALVRVGYTLPALAVKWAIDCCNVSCLEFICANNCCELTASHAALAAQSGVKLLELLHQYNCPWDVNTCINAATAETYEELAFAHTHGCAWDQRVCSRAIQSGRLHCLMYACENGCPCGENVCVEAAQCGQCTMLQFLHEQGHALTHDVCVAAASSNHTDCLQYAITHGCSWDVIAFYF